MALDNPTQIDLQDTANLERYLRNVVAAVNGTGVQSTKNLQTAISAVNAISKAVTAPTIQSALQSTGSAPLNVTGLQGILAQPQNAAIPLVTTLPINSSPLAQNGGVVRMNGILYVFDASTQPGMWVPVRAYSVDQVGLLSAIPAPASLPAGATYYATDVFTEYVNTGTVWITIGGALQELDDAGTNTDPQLLTLVHRSSGTPAANFGAALGYKLDSSTHAERLAGYLAIIWNVATNLAEGADFIVSLMSGGAIASQKFRVTKDGDSLISRDATIGRNLSMTGSVKSYAGSAPTNGQLLIGDTAAGQFNAASLTGTANQVIVTPGAGSVTLSTPQDLGLSSNVEFGSLTLSVTQLAVTDGGTGADNPSGALANLGGAPAFTGLNVTITTAALTTLGAQGSMTFTNGVLTAQTPAT